MNPDVRPILWERGPDTRRGLSGMPAIIALGVLRPIRARAGQLRFATDDVYRAFLLLHGHQRRVD